MSKIIRFPIERTTPRHGRTRRAAGKVVLFPGVRYEYLSGVEEHARPRISRRGHQH